MVHQGACQVPTSVRGERDVLRGVDRPRSHAEGRDRSRDDRDVRRGRHGDAVFVDDREVDRVRPRIRVSMGQRRTLSDGAIPELPDLAHDRPVGVRAEARIEQHRVSDERPRRREGEDGERGLRQDDRNRPLEGRGRVVSSQTTNVTEYVPVAPKTWLMTELPSVEFPPSSKFHSYRTIRPSGSFEADASKTRGVPTLPKGRAVVNVAFGGMSTYREADELFLPLKLSVTVKVTVYRPPRA